MTAFLRYHVLIRVFDGDIGRWLAAATNRSDVSFLRSLQRSVGANPSLLDDIRTIVDSSGIWPPEPDA